MKTTKYFKVQTDGGLDFLEITRNKSSHYIIDVTPDPLTLDELRQLVSHLGAFLEEEQRASLEEQRKADTEAA